MISIRRFFIFILLGIGVFVSINMRKADYLPDMQEFSRTFVSYIKTNDTLGISNMLNQINFTEYKELVQIIAADTLSPFNREFSHKQISDSMLLVQYFKLKEINSKTIVKIEEWKRKDSVDVAKLKFLRAYYIVLFQFPQPFSIIKDLHIYCAYDTIYYDFVFREITYTPKGFLSGKLRSIQKYSRDFEMLPRKEYEDTQVVIDSISKESFYHKVLQFRSDKAYNKYVRISDKLYSE